MPDKVSVRPSSLFRTMACPGSARLEAPFPWTDSPAAARGRNMHDAMALLFQVGEKAWDKIIANPLLNGKDVELLHDTFAHGTALLPDDPGAKVYIEHKLDLKFLGLDHGKPDAFFLSEKYKGVVVIDWKFGAGPVEDPDANPQLQAYGLGILETFKAKGFESVEGVMVQPSAWKEDDKVRSHVWSKADLDKEAKLIQAAVAQAQDPKAPLVPGQEQCIFCKAKGTCPAYATWNGQRQEMKQLAQETALATVTAGTPVEAVSELPLTSPVVVVSAELVARMEGLLATAQGITVVDEGTAQTAGRLSKDIRAQVNLIEKNREQVKRPYLEMGRAIDAAAKKATGPGEEAARLMDSQVRTWDQARQAENRRIQEEEAAKARAAEEARRRAQAEEQARVEVARAAAQRAQEEAARAENLKSAGARAKAQAAAQAAAEAAAKAQREAEAAQQAQLEAQRQADAAARAQEAARIASQAKVTGYRQDVDTTWVIPDFSKIPAALLSVVLVQNDKVIKQMIATGALTEAKDGAWIAIKREATMTRSR